MYHHYLPGKSQLILESFCLGTARANTVKRIGYFDDRNGIFLQQAGDGSLSFVLRSYITGGVGNTVIPQAQLIMIDFQWLGVGRIRIGFVHDGN